MRLGALIGSPTRITEYSGSTFPRKESMSAAQPLTKAPQYFVELDRAGMNRHVYPTSTTLTSDMFSFMELPVSYLSDLKDSYPKFLTAETEKEEQ